VLLIAFLYLWLKFWEGIDKYWFVPVRKLFYFHHWLAVNAIWSNFESLYEFSHQQRNSFGSNQLHYTTVKLQLRSYEVFFFSDHAAALGGTWRWLTKKAGIFSTHWQGCNLNQDIVAAKSRSKIFFRMVNNKNSDFTLALARPFLRPGKNVEHGMSFPENLTCSRENFRSNFWKFLSSY